MTARHEDDPRPRVLHLVEPGSPDGSRCRLRLLGDAFPGMPGVVQDVLVIGSAADARLARRLGLEPVGSHPAATRRPLAGRRSLRRLVAGLETARGAYDVFHAWSVGAATVANTALPRRARMGSFSHGPASPVAAAVAQYACRRFSPSIISGAPGSGRAGPWSGIPADDRVELPPAVSDATGTGEDREEVRSRWPVEPDTLVIGVLGDPPEHLDAMSAAGILNRMAATDRDVRVVISPRQRQRAMAERWLGGSDRARMVINDPLADEPWRIVAGLDAAVLLHAEPITSVLPALWAMAAGVPVIAEDGPDARAIVEPDRDGFIVEPDHLDAVCTHLVHLADDPELRRRLGDAAAQRVRRDFGLDAFRHELTRMYEAVTSEYRWARGQRSAISDQRKRAAEPMLADG